MTEFLAVDNSFVPKIGDKFYSDYFRRSGHVILYKDAHHWQFALDGSNEILNARCVPSDLTWAIE
jgi:hypothetical protein